MRPPTPKAARRSRADIFPSLLSPTWLRKKQRSQPAAKNVKMHSHPPKYASERSGYPPKATLQRRSVNTSKICRQRARDVPDACFPRTASISSNHSSSAGMSPISTPQSRAACVCFTHGSAFVKMSAGFASDRM